MNRLPLISGVGVLLLVCSLPWVRLNLSASVPRGLYRLHQVPTTLTYGQLVMVDVPAAFRPWWPRRMPLLKPVAGLPGDVLTIQDGHFYINSQDYGPIVVEAAGQTLPHMASYMVIDAGAVCLASRVPRSLDCRYTGPVARETLKALATPLWTWD
jgi:conjugative transfer signal peptidase TraF